MEIYKLLNMQNWVLDTSQPDICPINYSPDKDANKLISIFWTS